MSNLIINLRGGTGNQLFQAAAALSLAYTYKKNCQFCINNINKDKYKRKLEIFELLEKLGFHDWDFDYVLLDFLGDVVCGGFGLPIARDMAQKVILVGSNDLQSLYVANNVCSAVEYFRKLGGNVGVAGLVINKDDGSGEAAAVAKAVDIPVLASNPQDDDLRKKSANYQIVGTSKSQWGDLFTELAEAVAGAPPMRPKPLDSDGLLNLFDSKDTGADFTLVPATDVDMRGKNAKPKVSLEVVYDEA